MIRAALVAAVLLGGCAPSYLPVAETGGDAALKARIATDFPPGSPGERLRRELVREGFTILADPERGRYSALDRPPNTPCLSETRIDWTEDRRGRIRLVQAARHSCS